MTDKEFWIDVTTESPEMITKLDLVLDVCHEIYLWSLDRATEMWMENKEIPKVGHLSKELTKKIKGNREYQKVQRYTLNKVIEIAISQFFQELQIKEDGVVIFPTAIRRDDFNSFRIPVRRIWKKYLEEFSRISTAYGIFFMEGEWIKTLESQAGKNKITMFYMPYLWYNVTIRKVGEDWQIQFNLHQPQSHQGRIAKEKMKREGFKVT